MKAGQYITDGTAIFILDDVRDGNRVGDIVLKPTLNDGYIKANGATVKASEYPRLLKFAQDNSLCVSDSEWVDNSATKYVYDASADTLKVPNAMNRVLQGAEMLATREAGLPNFEAAFSATDNVARNVRGCFTNASGGCVIQNVMHPAVIPLVEQVTSDSFIDRVYLNANYYNSIYGASATVQPPACCLIAQIKY